MTLPVGDGPAHQQRGYSEAELRAMRRQEQPVGEHVVGPITARILRAEATGEDIGQRQSR